MITSDSLNKFAIEQRINELEQYAEESFSPSYRGSVQERIRKLRAKLRGNE